MSENIDRIDKATLALGRAHALIDSLFTITAFGGDGVEALCKGSLASILSCAMDSITEASEAIANIDEVKS